MEQRVRTKHGQDGKVYEGVRSFKCEASEETMKVGDRMEKTLTKAVGRDGDIASPQRRHSAPRHSRLSIVSHPYPTRLSAISVKKAETIECKLEPVETEFGVSAFNESGDAVDSGADLPLDVEMEGGKEQEAEDVVMSVNQPVLEGTGAEEPVVDEPVANSHLSQRQPAIQDGAAFADRLNRLRMAAARVGEDEERANNAQMVIFKMQRDAVVLELEAEVAKRELDRVAAAHTAMQERYTDLQRQKTLLGAATGEAQVELEGFKKTLRESSQIWEVIRGKWPVNVD